MNTNAAGAQQLDIEPEYDGKITQVPSTSTRTRSAAAERQARYRASRGVQVNVLLAPDLAEAFDAYMAREHADGQGRTRSQVIEHLLRTQLLRKR
jgi:hypothetical protein